MILWLIGRSGAGKTEVGTRLYRRVKARHKETVFLDGDVLRDVLGRELGYSPADRFISEERTSRLCRLLGEQGIHVICAKLSNSPELRAWNREHIPDYREVYLRVPTPVLEERDPKGLYAQFRRGELKQMVGLDIPFHEPAAPTLTVDGWGRTPDEIVDEILRGLDWNLDERTA